MTRRPVDTRTAAEKAFKAATTKPAELPPKPQSLPGVKEMVSLRVDRDVLDFFQADGPGWQERIMRRCAKRRANSPPIASRRLARIPNFVLMN